MHSTPYLKGGVAKQKAARAIEAVLIRFEAEGFFASKDWLEVEAWKDKIRQALAEELLGREEAMLYRRGNIW